VSLAVRLASCASMSVKMLNVKIVVGIFSGGAPKKAGSGAIG